MTTFQAWLTLSLASSLAIVIDQDTLDFVSSTSITFQVIALLYHTVTLESPIWKEHRYHDVGN